MGPGSYSDTGTHTCTNRRMSIEPAPSNVCASSPYSQTYLPKQHEWCHGQGAHRGSHTLPSVSYPYLPFPNPIVAPELLVRPARHTPPHPHRVRLLSTLLTNLGGIAVP